MKIERNMNWEKRKKKSGDKKRVKLKKRWKSREKNTELVHERKRGEESDAS